MTDDLSGHALVRNDHILLSINTKVVECTLDLFRAGDATKLFLKLLDDCTEDLVVGDYFVAFEGKAHIVISHLNLFSGRPTTKLKH